MMMMKRAVFGAALLVVFALSSVAEAGLTAIFSQPISGEELLTKLRGHYLEPSEVLRYMKQVSNKKETMIGGASVEQLIEMDDIRKANCKDNSHAKRTWVFEAAELSGIPNIDYYCRDRLNKLTRLCQKNPKFRGKYQTPITKATVAYFQSFLEVYQSFLASSKYTTDLEFMNWYLNPKQKTYDWKLGIPIDGPESDPACVVKAKQLRDNCNTLTSNVREMGTAQPSDSQAGNGLKMDFRSPEWSSVYRLCKYFLEHHRKHKEVVKDNYLIRTLVEE